MKKGPLLNNNSRRFSARNSLGIESVSTSIARAVCPVVNNQSARAFYWAFMVWIYYDFYKNSGIKEHTASAFDKKFLKRQDYFFVLSQLLNDVDDQYFLVGKRVSLRDINDNKTGMYKFNPNYFESRYGGMQYYNSGCIALDYIREIDVDNYNKRFDFPKLTKSGEKLALLFEEVIKDTEYYKNYRLKDSPVPEDVLLEYGKVINISLDGFEECKNDLRQHLFEIITPNNQRLYENAEYIRFIYDTYDMENAIDDSYRELLFDAFSPLGRNEDLKPELRNISNCWEIIIGRQYFTAGIECIWKYMLEQINVPRTKKEWISMCLNASEWSFDIHNKLSSILPVCEFDYITREQMIDDAMHFKNPGRMIENGLKIVLSIYNRLNDRSDFGNESEYLLIGKESSSISFAELFEKIEEYKERSVEEFLIYIMNHFLIEQHYQTAFEKLLQGRDGFFYEIIDGYYIKKLSFTIEFQGIRLARLAQVMKDLDLL